MHLKAFWQIFSVFSVYLVDYFPSGGGGVTSLSAVETSRFWLSISVEMDLKLRFSRRKVSINVSDT